MYYDPIDKKMKTPEKILPKNNVRFRDVRMGSEERDDRVRVGGRNGGEERGAME